MYFFTAMKIETKRYFEKKFNGFLIYKKTADKHHKKETSKIDVLTSVDYVILETNDYNAFLKFLPNHYLSEELENPDKVQNYFYYLGFKF